MKNKIITLMILILIILFLNGCVEEEKEIPYYFIAIHNEAYNIPHGIDHIVEDYATLQSMIKKADEYNIKLTLMFTPQWADYISESEERIVELSSWRDNGHEIAAHHHSIHHSNWDGYTDYTLEEALVEREKHTSRFEEYFGTLDNFTEVLKKLNPNMNSGCVNDEHDKNVMPDAIIYDTCSGYNNYGEPGVRSEGKSPNSGRNDYISVGVVNGIERKWLTHAPIISEEMQLSAQIIFEAMDTGVYGVVDHSIESQAQPYYEFLEFLHSKDPNAEKSMTVTEIIESRLLPEVEIPEEILQEIDSTTWQAVCGDGVCDYYEQTYENLCPEDC